MRGCALDCQRHHCAVSATSVLLGPHLSLSSHSTAQFSLHPQTSAVLLLSSQPDVNTQLVYKAITFTRDLDTICVITDGVSVDHTTDLSCIISGLKEKTTYTVEVNMMPYTVEVSMMPYTVEVGMMPYTVELSRTRVAMLPHGTVGL